MADKARWWYWGLLAALGLCLLGLHVRQRGEDEDIAAQFAGAWRYAQGGVPPWGYYVSGYHFAPTNTYSRFTHSRLSNTDAWETKTTRGTWRVDKGVLHMETESGESLLWAVEINGDRLRMTPLETKDLPIMRPYRRVENAAAAAAIGPNAMVPSQ